MALLAIVAAPLAGVFWSAIRTAGIAAHRTDGSSIASREIEGMPRRPVRAGRLLRRPDAGHTSTFETFTTVSLGATSPSSGSLIPQIQPDDARPQRGRRLRARSESDERAPNRPGRRPLHGRRGTSSGSTRKDASSTYTQAYKRLTVDRHVDRPGRCAHGAPGLVAVSRRSRHVQRPDGRPTHDDDHDDLRSPGRPTRARRDHSAGRAPPTRRRSRSRGRNRRAAAAPTSYSIEYSTNPASRPGTSRSIAGLAPSITNYTVTSLTPTTTYYFEIIAYAGANASTPSQWQSLHDRAAAAAGRARSAA